MRTFLVLCITSALLGCPEKKSEEAAPSGSASAEPESNHNPYKNVMPAKVKKEASESMQKGVDMEEQRYQDIKKMQ